MKSFFCIKKKKKTGFFLVSEQHLKIMITIASKTEKSESFWMFQLSQQNKIKLFQVVPIQLFHSLINNPLQMLNLCFLLFTEFLKNLCSSLKN